VSAKERILQNMARSDFVRSAYAGLRRVPGIGAVAQRLVHAAMPLGTKFWIQVPEGLGRGLWMYADPRFDLGYTNGDYEPWMQELLKAELAPGDCYYDVGAHAGFFSLIAARFVGASGKVVAFEPDPENVEALKGNIAKNGAAQVSIVQAAVWSFTTQLTFERAAEASNRTQGRIAASSHREAGCISVPAVCLDDLVFRDGYPRPQLIKMDVEGAEWEALQGARRLLGEVKPKLLCEIHDVNQMGQIRAYMEQFGYTADEWKPVHPHYAEYRQAYLWATTKPATP